VSKSQIFNLWLLHLYCCNLIVIQYPFLITERRCMANKTMDGCSSWSLVVHHSVTDSSRPTFSVRMSMKPDESIDRGKHRSLAVISPCCWCRLVDDGQQQSLVVAVTVVWYKLAQRLTVEKCKRVRHLSKVALQCNNSGTDGSLLLIIAQLSGHGDVYV